MMMVSPFRDIIERSVFGVCSYIGEKIGVASSRVRLYFVYLSFLTIGSPLLVYLIVAFWLNIRQYLRKGYDLIMQ